MLKTYCNSIFAKILFNVFRPVPMNLFGPIAYIKYRILAAFKKQQYLEAKAKWDGINSYKDLIEFFKNNYVYKFDLGRGFFDHDSSDYEWHLAFGDCDDAAKYAIQKLNTLGFPTKRIGLLFKQNGKLCAHFDALYEIDGKLYLFNYGYSLYGESMEQLISAFASSWKVTDVKYTTVWY